MYQHVRLQPNAIRCVQRTTRFLAGSCIIMFLAASLMSGCAQKHDGFRDPDRVYAPKNDDAKVKTFATQIHQPSGLGKIDTPLKDISGHAVGIECATCHSNRSNGTPMADSANLKGFHNGISLAHGNLDCNFCHSKSDKSQLHLADGTLLPFEDTMQLCAQCHGPQYRDYQHGSHGGMNGYWDLNQGPRLRNHCIDCHSPHRPAYQPMMPVHPPKDRYLDWSSSHHESPHQPAHGKTNHGQ